MSGNTYAFQNPSRDDGAYVKHADSTRIIELDFFPAVANFWEAGKEYASGDIVRPREPTGFAYQAGGNGQSGRRTPKWPETVSGTVVDGSITWTAVVAGSNGVDSVSAPSSAVDPSGALTSGSESVVEETRVQITLAGGTEDGGDEVTGKDGTTFNAYVVTVTVTAGDETIAGSILVRVLPK